MSRSRSDRHERRAEARAHKREHLLDSAIHVVRRQGPGASMDAIARQAGVTKPIVYRVFGDRDGLTQAIADRFADELRAALEAAIAGASNDRLRVSAAIDAYLSFIEREPAIVRFMVDRSFAEAGHEGVATSGFV